MGFTMGLNLLLLLAMVATNILSLYHLSTKTQPPPSFTQHHHHLHSFVPDHLLHQLQTIRSSINHLTRHQPSPPPGAASTTSRIPQDLLLYSQLNPIASSCHNHPDLLHQFMNYTPFSLCPVSSDRVVEDLILRGCHPLPRRRCFSRTPAQESMSLPRNPFPSALPEGNVMWGKYACKSFSCLVKQNPNSGFDMRAEISRFLSYKSELDLPIPQFLQLAKANGSVIRLGIDVGGGTATFAARMKQYNVTVVTTTMNFNVPNNEVVAMRGLVPLHVPLQQRLPVFDGVVDLVRCGRAVNRWIPTVMLEFLFFDVDRVLRGGGYLWIDRFFSKSSDLDKLYGPLIGKLGYKKIKWAVLLKTDPSGVKNGEVYLTALLQKPASR